MTDFKAKMHQIRFRLGLRPRLRWGILQRSPRPPFWIWTPLCGRGRGWVGEEEGKREGKGREGEVEGKERKGPQVTVEPGPLRDLLCHCHFFSNIDVACKYCLYYVNYLLFGQLTFY